MYLFSQPANVFEVWVCGGHRWGPQVGVDVRQGLWQQGSDVGVDGSEPGVGRRPIFTSQYHRVLAVWGMELQQPTLKMKDYVRKMVK